MVSHGKNSNDNKLIVFGRNINNETVENKDLLKKLIFQFKKRIIHETNQPVKLIRNILMACQTTCNFSQLLLKKLLSPGYNKPDINI